MSKTLLSTIALAGLLTVGADAQVYTELLRQGDPVPGAASGELVASIRNVDINGNGDWLVELDGNGATNADRYMLLNGNIIWQEGTSLGFSAPAGKEASGFLDVMDINENGDILFITPVRDVGTVATNGFLTVWNGVTVIEDGVTPCLAPGLPAGTIWEHVSEARHNDNAQLLITGSVLLGGTESTGIMARMDLDPAGAVTSEVKLALEGEIFPGPNHVTPIEYFSFVKSRLAINNDGTCIWHLKDESDVSPGDPAADSNFYTTDAAYNNVLLYNEADAFPTDPTDVFNDLAFCRITLNNNGDYVFSGYSRESFADDSWLFKSIGGTITAMAHEGDPVPASVPGGFLVINDGFGGHMPFSDYGDAMWFLEWNDPDTDKNSGLMRNEELLLQEGVSTLSGLVIDEVPFGSQELAMSDDGRFSVLEVFLEDGTVLGLNAIFLMEFCPEVGETYCSPAVANSSGGPASLKVTGSDTAADNEVTLLATDLPTNQFGFFLNSPVQGFSNPMGGQGNLCLASPIGRYNSSIFTSGAGGIGSLTLDLTNTPTPTGPVPVKAGETWNFQCWFRDVNPLPTSNFTDAVAVIFN